jgi:hypothetical protein
MDRIVKRNAVRTVAGLTLFIVFLFLSVELQIKRLEIHVANVCTTAGFDCVRDRITLARWQSPFNSIPWQSAEQAFVETMEGGFTEEERAELLWELRAALFGSRSVIRPETVGHKSDLLQKIDAILLPEKEMVLEKKGDIEPGYLYQIGAQIFFYLWIALVMLAIWRGMNAKGEINWKVFSRFFGGAVCAFCTWLFCLSLA